MMFLEDAVKKTLKRPILKVARKGKAPNKEELEDISVGGDKGFKANFWGWIGYFWRGYADGMDECGVALGVRPIQEFTGVDRTARNRSDPTIESSIEGSWRSGQKTFSVTDIYIYIYICN